MDTNNGKVRVVVFEVEGSNATIQGVVDRAVEMFEGRRAAAPVVAVAGAAEAARELKLAPQQTVRRTLAAPKKVQQTAATPAAKEPKKVQQTAAIPAAEPAVKGEMTLASAARKLLADGPLADAEIREKARPMLGFTPTSQQLYAVTWALKKNGEICRDNATGKWMLAE